MQRESFSGGREAEVLAGLVGHTAVLGRVVPHWQGGGLFPSRAANLVAGWCIEHYRKHGKPPRKGIAVYFRDWAEHADAQETEAVGRLLERVDEVLQSSHHPTAELLIDQAGNLFNRARLQKHKDDLDAYLEAGQVDRALACVTDFRKVEMGAGAGTKLLSDLEAVKAVFRKELREPLFTYPGALGKFFGDTFHRNAFVSFMGPEGSGKSYLLLDLAVRALKARRRVAYFDAGDMTADQVAERFLVRLARHPVRSPMGEWPCEVSYPTAFRVTAKAAGDDIYRPLRKLAFASPLTEKVAWRACQAFRQKVLRTKDDLFVLSCHANSTLTVATLRSILDGWALDGWVPDVVVLDYADILAPLDRRAERRDQVNDNWQALRRLSAELHCLVVTATQANRESYRARTVRMEHTGEDKRKSAHVLSMVGISRTDEEKADQLTRLNWVKRREGASSPHKQVYLAGCFDLANPAVRSCFRERGGEAD